MDQLQIYIAISAVALAIVAALFVFVAKKSGGFRLSKLGALAFVFIIAGIIFSGNRAISYGLTGIGLIFALLDIIKKVKERSGSRKSI